jgi:hypothetical protein
MSWEQTEGQPIDTRVAENASLDRDDLATGHFWRNVVGWSRIPTREEAVPQDDPD